MTEASSEDTGSEEAGAEEVIARDWDVKAKPVMVTAKAIEMVRIALKEEGLLETHGLRVAVQGGGCSGLQYALDFANESRPGDFVYELDGMKIYIDLASRKFLEGTKVDYVSGLQGNGFKFDNPNAERSCGCGHSFS